MNDRVADVAHTYRHSEASQKRGGQLLKTPADFPSSRTCSNCGVNSGQKPLSLREWKCPNCCVYLDRDFNAGVNIRVAAGHAETRNACGGDVRRERARAVAREPGTRLNRAAHAQQEKEAAAQERADGGGKFASPSHSAGATQFGQRANSLAREDPRDMGEKLARSRGRK